jgi:hypothetical protein
MTDIIQDASSNRLKLSDDDTKRHGIAITDGCFDKLKKHPYHSSKQLVIKLVARELSS